MLTCSICIKTIKKKKTYLKVNLEGQNGKHYGIFFRIFGGIVSDKSKEDIHCAGTSVKLEGDYLIIRKAHERI